VRRGGGLARKVGWFLGECAWKGKLANCGGRFSKSAANWPKRAPQQRGGEKEKGRIGPGSVFRGCCSKAMGGRKRNAITIEESQVMATKQGREKRNIKEGGGEAGGKTRKRETRTHSKREVRGRKRKFNDNTKRTQERGRRSRLLSENLAKRNAGEGQGPRQRAREENETRWEIFQCG